MAKRFDLFLEVDYPRLILRCTGTWKGNWVSSVIRVLLAEKC